MALYATVRSLDVGYQWDKDRFAEADLKLGSRYGVADVEMGQSHTNIYLEGFGASFNSVAFEFDEDGAPIDIYADPRYNPYI